YSLRLGAFPVNPIHDGILEYYRSVLGVQHWTRTDWKNFLLFLLTSAPIPVLTGAVPGVFRFRRCGYLAIIVLLLFAVWLQSVGYTSGGAIISTRVLSPALVVLSILGAGLLEPLTRRAKWYAMTASILVVCHFWTAAYGVFYP